MSKVKFDGEEGSIELERITAKKNWMSPEQCNKMGATYMFNALHRYMGEEMYPDLPNEVNGNVAVKQLPVYAFLKTKIEGTDQYNRKYIGNFTVGADKGDNGYFGLDNELCKDTAIRLEGTDHIKGVGFNYPWEVNGVKNIRYNADKKSLCIITGNDKTAWSAILEQSYCGNKKSEAEIEAYLEQEFKPAFDCAYRANPLLVGVTMTLDEINADIDGFKALRRSSDDRQYSYCEFWIDGEYDLYYLNLERNRYEKNGINLYDELSDEEKALVDAAETLEEKNQVFINFRINRFKEEAPNYWHINDGLYQLSFLYTIAAKDNGEKNMYPYKLIPLSEGGRWRFFQDDLDSIKAKDNQGLDTAPYSVELHDFTDDKKNAYVFKGEDNAYFQALEMAYPERSQKMGKDMLQAMYELSPKGTKTLDKLMGFFDEFFFSRAQDYFTKSAYNNDAEFYEEAWNDKEYVASVDIHPLAQSTGDHYTADRAWLEKRMLYLMAKYGFGSYSNYEDSSLGIISVRTQVAQGFTLTPAIDSFPTILGGQAQISKADHRIKAGESIKLAAVGGGNTNTYIVGADWLSDIGDLKDLSIDPSSVVVLSVASKRLRRLKVGDENPEEVTSYLATLAVQKCDSMETVDARNLKTLVGTVDLSKCPRLLEALFGGTNTTGVVIAAGSKIEHLQLPDSVTAIDLRNTKFLENFEYGTLANLGFLRLENVPTLNAFAMLKEAYNSEGSQLKDIRLVGWTYDGDATDVDMIANLANDKDKDGNHHPYNGIDAEGTPTTGNPVLEGKLNIDGYVYEETANIVKQNFPTIEFTPKGYYIRFYDKNVLKVLLDNGVGDGVGITKEAAEKVTSIGSWFKGNTTIESFDEFAKFTGVTSLIIGSYTSADVGYQGAFSQCTALKHISLPSSLTDIGNGSFSLCTLLDTKIPESVVNIRAKAFYKTALSGEIYLPNLNLAQEQAFAYTKITKLNLPVLSDKISMIASSAKELIEVTSLGSIQELSNGMYNSSTPGEYMGAFAECDKLTTVNLPDSLKFIGSGSFAGCQSLHILMLDFTNISTINKGAFYGCTSLEIEDLYLPNLETLGQNAFYGVKVKKISNLGKITTLPTGNNNTQNYGDKSILEEVVLPSSITSIPSFFLYYYSALKNIQLPSSIEIVNGYAFDGCKNMESFVLNLPNLTTLAHAAFYNSGVTEILNLGRIAEIPYANNYNSIGCFTLNGNLTKVNLPNTLKYIGNYAFQNCAMLTDIELPTSLTKIGGSAFFAVPAHFIIDLPNLTDLGQAAFINSGVKRILNLGSISSLRGNNDYNSFGDFYNCINLELAILPDTLTSIGAYALRKCPNLRTIIVKTETPPSLGGNTFSGSHSDLVVYVPDSSVEAYKIASNWNTYAERIRPTSQLQTDNPELHEEIGEYL